MGITVCRGTGSSVAGPQREREREERLEGWARARTNRVLQVVLSAPGFILVKCKVIEGLKVGLEKIRFLKGPLFSGEEFGTWEELGDLQPR